MMLVARWESQDAEARFMFANVMKLSLHPLQRAPLSSSAIQGPVLRFSARPAGRLCVLRSLVLIMGEGMKQAR